MIIGIGSDLTNITRIEDSLKKYSQRFLERTFTPAELGELKTRERLDTKEYASAVSRRFAAKEAASKALGTGFNNGISWQDFQILHLASGQPQLHISGKAAEHLLTLTEGKEFTTHISITDDYPWAQAFVIIETI